MATMNISLPDQMKAWVEAQSADGRYANSSDYVRDLIRREQIKAEKIAHMQALVDEARASGLSDRTMEEIFAEARARAIAQGGADRSAHPTGEKMTHPIHIGIGGWTYEPWRGAFYPEKLSQKKELEYASRALTSIEINGTYYSTFKPDSWMKWRDETPDGFVFAVKASRYCTNRKVLSDMGESMERFLGQGLSALGDRLGPINWQFMATKKFDPVDFEGFLKLLPKEQDGGAAATCAGGAEPDVRYAAVLRSGGEIRGGHRLCRGRRGPRMAPDRPADRRLYLRPADVEPRGRANGHDVGRTRGGGGADAGLGAARRGLCLFHCGGEGPEPGGGAGADQKAGLNRLRRAAHARK